MNNLGRKLVLTLNGMESQDESDDSSFEEEK